MNSKLRTILMLFSVCVLSMNAFSQDLTIDSLKLALKNAKHDKIKCSILRELAETADDNEWPAFNEQLIVLAEKNVKLNNDGATKSFYIKQLATGLNNKAVLYQLSGNRQEALNLFF